MCVYEFGSLFHSALVITICTLLLPCLISLPCPVMGAFPYKNLIFFFLMEMGVSIFNSTKFYQIESLHVCI